MAFHTKIGESYRAVRRRIRHAGFTLIELLVVLAIIAALLTIVTPRYFQQTERAREVVLKHNLRSLREAIDHYRQDWGEGPSSLDDLVSRRYLHDMPLDPVTNQRDTWTTEEDDSNTIRDVRSGAPGNASDGTPYEEW